MKVHFQDIISFAKENSFGFYIVDDFSSNLVPIKGEKYVAKDFTAGDMEKLEKIYSRNCGEILAIGAGAVLDPAKFLAAKYNKTLTVIPTALSTNSFATNRSSFLSGNSKKSFSTKSPDIVVIDRKLLFKAGMLNYFGVIEVAATCSAQIDWTLAQTHSQDVGNQDISERAERLIGLSLNLLRSSSELPQHIDELIEALMESGNLTVTYGTGRPVSGSEHIISAYIENRFHCPHGVGLYVAIQIAHRLHEIHRISDRVEDSIVALLMKISDVRKYIQLNIPETELMQSLLALKPREGRFTILDIASLDDLATATEDICARIYSTTP
jgi:glycerol dehydrogenase-like iron-containing ADH family enzyme